MERRSNGSFVIFRFGEDNSENVILNLPSVLLSDDQPRDQSTGTSNINTPSVPRTQPQDGTTDNNNASAESNTEANNNTNDSSGNSASSNDDPNNVSEEHIERNMLVSVSYIYSGEGSANRPQGTTGSNETPRRGDRTGSILLNVPNIPSHRSESQLNALIEFAASLALSAITANIRRRQGIKKETFDKFPIKSKKDLTDTTCSICYDEFTEPAVSDKGKDAELNSDDENDLSKDQRKRKRRVSDEGNEERQSAGRKVRRTESISVPSSGSSSTPSDPAESNPATTEPSSTDLAHNDNNEKTEEYEHVPVVLPCNHYFGRSCIYEWLKSNSTCPLCRQPVVEENSAQNAPPDRINIPNIDSLLHPTTRDNPMVVVLDRATNTLTTRFDAQTQVNNATTNAGPNNSTTGSNNTAPTAPSVPQVNDNTPEAAVTRSLLSALTEPRGIPVSGTSPPRRDPLTASILRGLNQPRYSGLFPSGVSSRRTRTGVETVNLENDGFTRNDFDETFYDESRRLIEERLRSRHLRDQQPQTSPTAPLPSSLASSVVTAALASLAGSTDRLRETQPAPTPTPAESTQAQSTSQPDSQQDSTETQTNTVSNEGNETTNP